MANSSSINTKLIFGEFWRATKKHRLVFFASFVCFLLGFIANVFVPVFYKEFFDTLSIGKSDLAMQRLYDIVVAIAILHLTAWAFGRAGIFCANAMQAKVSAQLKQNAFDYMMLHSRDFFANNFSGSLVQRTNRFARAFIRITDVTLFEMMQLVITVTGAIIVTAVVAPAVSITIAIWLAVFTVFNLFFSRKKIKYDILSAEADSKTTGLLADCISNYSSITLYNGYKAESELFAQTSNDQAKKLKFSWDLWSVINMVQVGSTYLIEFFIFFFGISFWHQGLISLGTFTLIQIYIIGVGQQLWSMNRIIREIYESLADSQEMMDILSLPHEIVDAAGAKDIGAVAGKIELKKVTFAYDAGRPVLENINLNIKAGEKVALVGPSGTGKTTLVGLILRVHDPRTGAVCVDGKDIKNVTLDSLHANISLVPQDPVLFHRTIMENIRYGSPDASDAEVIAAAKAAHCDEFIEQMPCGFQTYVGERGVKLSGGERQRVAIARAILKRAPILVLDEATSSLDSKSEMLIQDALDKLMENCTTIAIAHRLSTIRRMDRIIVMDSGGIVEMGTHQMLIRRANSVYRQLWTLQAGGFIQ